MEGKDDLLDELSKYLELLDAFMATRDQGIIQEQGDGTFANLGSNLDLLTQFSMFTWGAVGTLTGEASAGLEIADLEAEAAAKFTSSYQVQRVSYRYQSINKGNAGETLVSTQDTYISYRNYGFSASAEAKVTYDDFGAIKEAELSDSYATMTYLSIIRFWKHPFAAHFAENRMEINLWERSGFSYGMSVPFHHLIDCANGKQPKLKTAIMEQLRVAEEDLNTFLSAAKKTVFGQVKADEDGFYNESNIPDQVFLESAFTFGPKKKMWAKFIRERDPRFNYFRPIDGIEANPALKKTGLIADSSVKL